MARREENSGLNGGGFNKPPRAPEGSRIYAVGDIHGRADLLATLLNRIRGDADSAAGLRKVLVYVGDYIDRGADSFAVVETVIGETPKEFEAVHLKGNHEDFLMHFIKDGSLGDSWMMNGGIATLLSYGVDFRGHPFLPQTLAAARRDFLGLLPRDHMNFYQGLKTSHFEGDYLFVHAGLKPGVPIDDQDEFDLMWIREEFLDSGIDFGPMIVHGHTIGPQPEVHGNRIGIDTGAYHTGRLTCLVLENDSRRFLHT